MRKFYLSALTGLSLILVALTTTAQPYGNEWIDYSKIHYKIKVWQEGIYRIPYSTLAASIPNIQSLNPQTFVMYRNGVPVPIWTSNEVSFGTSDYIEFYGRPNDGLPDSSLYAQSAFQPHTDYSLFTDTAIYFLTTTNNPGNPRFADIPNSLINLPAQSQFYFHTERVILKDRFYPGKNYRIGTDDLYKSTFEESEGFLHNRYFGNVSDNGSPQDVDQSIGVPVSALFASGGSSSYRFLYVTRSAELHNIRVRLNGTTVHTNNVSGYSMNRLQGSIASSNLQNGQNAFVFSELSSQPISKQQNVVSFVELRYPRQFDMQGRSFFRFSLDGDAASRKYFEITNFNANGGEAIVYDVTNGYRVRATAQGGGVYPVVLPASASDRTLLVYGPSATGGFFTVTSMTAKVFVNYTQSANQGNYLLITENSLLNDGSGNNYPRTFADYRDRNISPVTGRYQSLLINVEELYDQFGFGISKSPLGIRNFLLFAYDRFSTRPEFVFLVGKGREYPGYRGTSNLQQQSRAQTLLPTFGSPGSDMLYACRRGESTPLMSVGRLSAASADDVRIYLNKVTEYESNQRYYTEPMRPIADKEWMKHVMHFGGGTTTYEQGLFRSYLRNYEATIEDTSFGGEVTAYYKNISAPIQDLQSQAIRSRIDEGVSMITFFGHSSTGAFDINFDEPENYTNDGKYPLVISNGCFSGNIFDRTRGYSERFVFAENKAAIAFMATSGLSVSSGLNNFTSRFYQNIASKTYGKELGAAIRLAQAQMDTCCSASNFDQMVAFEMTLHGDPALLFNSYGKPDYAIEASSVFFSPATVTASNDSFDLKIAITNLGKAIRDSISVLVIRNAGGQQLSYRQVVRAPYFKDTVSVKIPVRITPTTGFGLNQFSIYTEADRRIDEMSELNNDLVNTVSLFIAADDVIPVYPYEFSIVPVQNVELKASTVDPFAPVRTYRFEIDTTENFNSALIQSAAITQSGGLVKWRPGLAMTDSTVYYWRVGTDSNGIVSNWHGSSFVYLNGEYPGWNQSHYYQYLKDEFLYTRLDADRVFRFVPNTNEIRVITGTSDPGFTVWQLNNSEMHKGRMVNCSAQQGGITFAVIDGETGVPWISTNTNGSNYARPYGNAHCNFYYYQQNGFDFFTSDFRSVHPDPYQNGKTWSQAVRDFVQSIPDGSYVLMYTVKDARYTTWDTAMVNAILGLGASGIVDLTSGVRTGSYIYFTQKGNSNFSPVQVYSPGSNFTTSIDTTLIFSGTWNSGNIRSTVIGPASEWGSFHWRTHALETPDYDIDSVDVFAVNAAGTDSFLFRKPPGDYGLQQLNAREYPKLKLVLETRDDSLRTPTQLDYWRVLYKPVPEGVINPSAYFFVEQDTLGIGQDLNIGIAFENITETSMDSVLTAFRVRDAANNIGSASLRFDSLPGGDTIILRYRKTLNSNTYNGSNQLVIEANPDEDQPEQFHFNNFAIINFTAEGDVINPLLDVTFDGRRIMNGDLVSARPQILVTLRDENKFLALDDTALIEIYLRYPGESTPRKMSYDQQSTIFYPADAGMLNKRNEARVELKPILTLDGKYELIVKNRDKSGNNSSSTDDREEDNLYYDYKINFEVQNKSSVSNVLNYPNPFSTSTRFVFTLTGSEVPDQFMIQIMTVSGKVVKEIKRQDLGNLVVGRNVTTYAWDGRDEFGDVLANGVYFYRVVVKDSGKTIDKLNSSSSLINADFDKYFKKGFGKMVILR